MAYKIVIQEGHINSGSSSLHLGSGAPGEQELTKRIGDRLGALLTQKGFEVKVTDANAYADNAITSQDWNLFLALHGDADYTGDMGSGFADYPEPSTDGATAESQRIASLINQSYFIDVKINYINRSNANTRYYYMWKYLSAKTPCVLVEMGQVQDSHDKILLANTDLIANALGRCICKAFNVPFDVQVPPVTPPPIVITPSDPTLSLKAEIATLKAQWDIANKSLTAKQTEMDTKLAEVRRDCQSKLDNFKTSLLKIINETV